MQTSRDKQLRRFEERAKVPFKQFKITEEDWRNHDKWDAYQQAVCDMVERTSTGEAPWTLVESDDKRHARVKILRTLCERLEAELERGRPDKEHASAWDGTLRAAGAAAHSDVCKRKDGRRNGPGKGKGKRKGHKKAKAPKRP